MIIEPLIKKATDGRCHTLDNLVKYAFFDTPEPPPFMQQAKPKMPKHLQQSLGIKPQYDLRTKFLSYLTGNKPRQTDDLLAALRTLSKISGFFRGFGG